MLPRIPAIYSAQEEKPSLRWNSYAESIVNISIIRANPYMYRKAAINTHSFIYLFIFITCFSAQISILARRRLSRSPHLWVQ